MWWGKSAYVTPMFDFEARAGEVALPQLDVNNIHVEHVGDGIQVEAVNVTQKKNDVGEAFENLGYHLNEAFRRRPPPL